MASEPANWGWHGSVEATRPDGSLCHAGDSGATLAEALTRLVQDATYYLGMGYSPVWIRGVAADCLKCGTTGQVPKAKFGFKPCPVCKGGKALPPSAVPDFEVKCSGDISTRIVNTGLVDIVPKSESGSS